MKNLYLAAPFILILSLSLIRKEGRIRKEGHLYKTEFSTQGTEILTHVDSCGCWTKLNDKPN